LRQRSAVSKTDLLPNLPNRWETIFFASPLKATKSENGRVEIDTYFSNDPKRRICVNA
jgi:hypothetical protein